MARASHCRYTRCWPFHNPCSPNLGLAIFPGAAGAPGTSTGSIYRYLSRQRGTFQRASHVSDVRGLKGPQVLPTSSHPHTHDILCGPGTDPFDTGSNPPHVPTSTQVRLAREACEALVAPAPTSQDFSDLGGEAGFGLSFSDRSPPQRPPQQHLSAQHGLNGPDYATRAGCMFPTSSPRDRSEPADGTVVLESWPTGGRVFSTFLRSSFATGLLII